jgi:GNAT superfamily N-acetyltransferase
MELRKARREDLPRLEAWSRDFEQGAHGEPFIGRTFDELERRPELGGIYIIESGAGAVGYAILLPWWSNEYRGEALLIDELYVAPEHRGGTGRAAVDAIERLARARGVKVLSLEVLPGAARVHSLYQRTGFESGRTLYRKKI